MKKYLFYLPFFAFLALSCGSSKKVADTPPPAPPSTFIESADAVGWSSIFIRDGIQYEQAFNEVLDVIAKHYEMDMISKEGGYGRSNWIITTKRTTGYWNGVSGYWQTSYKTRVIFKFSADRTQVDIKTEAQWNNGRDSDWHLGYDGELLQTIKQDIEGSVGRTVK